MTTGKLTYYRDPRGGYDERGMEKSWFVAWMEKLAHRGENGVFSHTFYLYVLGR